MWAKQSGKSIYFSKIHNHEKTLIEFPFSSNCNNDYDKTRLKNYKKCKRMGITRLHTKRFIPVHSDIESYIQSSANNPLLQNCAIINPQT